MNLLPLLQSPIGARVVPYLIFLFLTFAEGLFGETARYWFYAAKTVVGAWMLWMVRPWIPEMKWRFSGAAVATGFAVFVIWIGLRDVIRVFPAGVVWNPHLRFGAGSTVAWLFVAVRLLGSSLVVPPLEEVFFRSFVYRFIKQPDFQNLPLGQFLWLPFLVTSVLFGLEHRDRDWIAGILCGFAYQGLVCWKKRLGDAITAHAITNFLLGLWIITKGAWHFW